jgi:hypothetical protein
VEERDFGYLKVLLGGEELDVLDLAHSALVHEHFERARGARADVVVRERGEAQMAADGVTAMALQKFEHSVDAQIAFAKAASVGGVDLRVRVYRSPTP